MPPLPACATRPLRRHEVAPVAAMLARAFADDPVMTFLTPGDRQRPRRLRRFFGRLLSGVVLPYGEVTVTDDLASAALWSPPNPPAILAALHATEPVGLELRDFWPLLRVATSLGRASFRRRNPMADAYRAAPSVPYWYLMVLGTEPSRQGQGLGSAVLAPVLARCDRDGIPAFLESSKERNVPFYRHHGFEVTKEVTLAEDGPQVWCMERAPGA